MAIWLKNQGYTVGEIRIPPPATHPHQSQMNSVLILLLAFAIMSLLLSAILTATMISSLLAQQIRQIGIMKAIGARSRQIMGLYLALVALLGLIAVIIGLPLGIIAGRGLADVMAQMLNFTLYSLSIPVWIYITLVLMGILVPLLVALIPILRTSRSTVREIVTDYGTNRKSFNSRGLDGLLSRIRGIDKTLLLSLRNTFRRQGRLLLTLGLLAAAGAMFMTGLNVKAGWEDILAQGTANQHYDLEVRLNSPQSEKEIFAIVSSVSGVRQVESWNFTPAAVSRPDGLDIVRTYPDGGHGSLLLRSAPPESHMLTSSILSGRWLQDGDTNGIVLNQMATAFFPNVKVGDAISLTVNGHVASFHVIGLAQQIMTPAAAYVIPSTFADATGIPMQKTDDIRIVMNAHDAATVNATTEQIIRALEGKNISVLSFIPKTALEGAVDNHTYIFIYSLISMAVIMAVVGALGLMSSMGTSVTERTREFGVMRSIGAKSHTILRNIISEGLFVGLMSWIIAVPLSIIPTLVVDNLIGSMFFRVPLPLIMSSPSLGIWFLIITVGSIVASTTPAWRASRLTIRESLAYV